MGILGTLGLLGHLEETTAVRKRLNHSTAGVGGLPTSLWDMRTSKSVTIRPSLAAATQSTVKGYDFDAVVRYFAAVSCPSSASLASTLLPTPVLHFPPPFPPKAPGHRRKPVTSHQAVLCMLLHSVLVWSRLFCSAGSRFYGRNVANTGTLPAPLPTPMEYTSLSWFLRETCIMASDTAGMDRPARIW